MTLGEKIKFLRTQNNITQELLAEKLNVSRSAIAKWETNSGIPEIGNLKMIAELFGVSIDTLIDDTKKMEKVDTKNRKKFSCSEYAGKYYDIELNGWNDGVTDALIWGEDEDFLFYQKPSKKRNVCGLIGKKYITSVTATKQSDIVQDDISAIDIDYFCEKRVFIELAHKEGFIKGFFDFRNDDYRDVVIQSFSNFQVLLKYGRTIEVDAISKIEELDD